MSATQTFLPKKHSVALVVCYFGKLPPYVDCVWRSCEANHDINWILVTDTSDAGRVPPNVTIVRTTLKELKDRFSEKLGFEVNLSDPRLLCDFRPAYGYLLEEELAGYDFWGHCDLDMIFGDLRKFLPENLFENYDKILNRGHLCLYRNSDKVNGYFRLTAAGVPHYKDVFQSGKNNQFDEWRGIYRILRCHNIPQYHDEFIVDVPPPTRWKRPRFEGLNIKNHPLQLFFWHRGKVFQSYFHEEGAPMDCEFAYIHFQKRRIPRHLFDPWKEEGFFITPAGFFPYDKGDLNEEDFREKNRTEWRALGEILDSLGAGVKRKLHSLVQGPQR